ncbi:flavin-dependent dehydrogenase [Pedobacter sp. AK013]|uniref:NAD(P)/FAD-dependent oxidoreductase n=1 Tax=Pedobacter sp. AK013 TaxID=2723071 RepID=UPI0016110B23|nr:tryptophan 7-halogenase [Pedobacter sp. AK013]MBB6238053.1 flavin-dependent dehydrogenase [Pedobacter sp. AK013]
MIEKVYDVILIGAGTAGLSSAIRCLQHELNCVMITGDITKLDYPFQSTPAESVHPGLDTLMNMLSADKAITSNSRGTYTRIYDGELFQELGRDENGAWTGTHIDKPGFVKSLFSVALSYGLNTITGEKIKTIKREKDYIIVNTSTGNQIKSRFIIDGSGKEQVAGKLLKIGKTNFSNPIICWSGLSRITNNNQMASLKTSFQKYGQNWLWLAPEINHYCTWTQVSTGKNKIYQAPVALLNASLVSPIQIHSMRWRLYNQVYTDRIFLCGDAAGLLDPSSGQGILMSVMSGIFAADTIAGIFSKEHSEAIAGSHYQQWFQQVFRDKVSQLNKYYAESSFNG